MRYTLANTYANAGMTVDIPDDYLRSAKASNGGSVKAAIESYLGEHGYLTDAEMGAAADYAKAYVIEKSQENKSRRKPDDTKRALIAGMYAYLSSLGHLEGVEVTNAERIIAFSIGDDKYEITLSKKRAAKK